MLAKVIVSNENLGQNSVSIEYAESSQKNLRRFFCDSLGTDCPTFYDVRIGGKKYTIVANIDREFERFPGEYIWGNTARAEDRIEGFFSTIILTKRNFLGKFRTLEDDDIMRIYASMRVDIVRNSCKNRKTIVYNVIKK